MHKIRHQRLSCKLQLTKNYSFTSKVSTYITAANQQALDWQSNSVQSGIINLNGVLYYSGFSASFAVNKPGFNSYVALFHLLFFLLIKVKNSTSQIDKHHLYELSKYFYLGAI